MRASERVSSSQANCGHLAHRCGRSARPADSDKLAGQALLEMMTDEITTEKTVRSLRALPSIAVNRCCTATIHQARVCSGSDSEVVDVAGLCPFYPREPT